MEPGDCDFGLTPVRHVSRVPPPFPHCEIFIMSYARRRIGKSFVPSILDPAGNSPPIAPEAVVRMLELFAEGLSYAEIARQINCDPKSVANIVRQQQEVLQIKSRKPKS